MGRKSRTKRETQQRRIYGTIHVGVGTSREREVAIDHSDVVDAFLEQKRRFTQKFGRPPGPNDPVFFNEEAAIPEPMTEAQLDEMHKEIADIMLEQGINPAYVYAYRKTGLMLSETNRDKCLPEDVAEFMAAWDEYDQLHVKQ